MLVRVLLFFFTLFTGFVALGADVSLIVVFGPAGAENGRVGARAVASAIRSLPATPLEIRRSAAAEPVLLEPKLPAREWEQALLEAARDSREADAGVFVNALDSAAQSLAARAGARTLIAVLQSPPLSGEAEAALERVAQFCQANGVRVVVFDPSAEKSPGGVWERFPIRVASGRTLAGAMRQAGATQAAAESPSAASTVPAGGLIVRTRFVRTSPRGTLTYGVERHTSSVGAVGGGGLVTSEGGSNVELANGPMRGMFLVESPLQQLQFDVDDNSGTYLAKARVTQVARDASGKAVWTARKEMTIKGPLGRLAARKEGNLYYLREVVLPGRQYTLEATVEDLLAGKSGVVREPVRTGDGAPGFYVSDAMFVRPFAGSKDRFEADQVLSHDGNALSPMLSPEFRAGDPLNLQLYLVIYPDLFGAQPELSLEILQNGRSVGKVKLPFTDKIRDTTREGRGTIQGEQKRQFPFLATLRGAKLSAGEFEARVTVQQGKNMVVRSAPFRVLGDGQAVAEVDVARPVGSASPAAESESDVVLPEIDPVAVRTTGPSLPAEEADRLWKEATEEALGYSSKLPNFRCLQETRRLTAPSRSPDQLRVGDVILDELVYENGHESYHTLEVNGLKADKTRNRLEGVRSRGEFGTMLKSLFGKDVAAKYQWAGRAMAGGVLCQVFDIEVAPDKSNFVLQHNTRQEIPGYTGKVFIDEESGLVRRLTINGQGLPKTFELQSPSMSLEYGMVRVGSQDYLLPLRSVLQVRQGKTLVRNETVFRGYRKFEATSDIKY